MVFTIVNSIEFTFRNFKNIKMAIWRITTHFVVEGHVSSVALLTSSAAPLDHVVARLAEARACGGGGAEGVLHTLSVLTLLPDQLALPTTSAHRVETFDTAAHSQVAAAALRVLRTLCGVPAEEEESEELKTTTVYLKFGATCGVTVIMSAFLACHQC